MCCSQCGMPMVETRYTRYCMHCDIERSKVNMKCPLLKVSSDRHGGMELIRAQDCLKEECAWWSRVEQECHFVSSGNELYLIRKNLGEIAKELTLLRSPGVTGL